MNEDSDVVSTRILKVPREVVFRAFSEPEHLSQWWGLRGFRNTFHEFDFRPGAHWHFTLHGPDGTDYQNEYVLPEVGEPERIVISHPDPKHNFQLTIILAEEGEMTWLTWRMRFESAETLRAGEAVRHCSERTESGSSRSGARKNACRITPRR